MKIRFNTLPRHKTIKKRLFRHFGSPKVCWMPALVIAFGSLAISQAQAQTTIAHWSFDSLGGAGGDVFSDSGNNYNAMVNDNTLVTVDTVDQKFGSGAASFAGSANAGSDAYATIPSLPILTTSFTVAAWTYQDTGSSYQSVLSDWANPYAYLFGFSGSDHGPIAPVRNTAGQASPNNFNSTAAVSLDAWHHVAWVFDRSPDGSSATITTYVDGAASGSPVTWTPASGSVDINNTGSSVDWIGLKADNNYSFTGKLDELWVINGTLDQTQVQDLMNNNTFVPVPEPASMAIVGLGCIAMGALRFRRRV